MIKQIKSVIFIQPYAFGSYSIQASRRLFILSALMTPKFYSFAFSKPSITAAIDKFMISHEISRVNDMK
jgi:hypothetical protein